MKRLGVLPLILAFGWGGAVGAEVKVTNPGFAGRETLEYTETVGAVTRPFSVSLVLVGTGSAARYEYRTAGADGDSVYRIDPVSLLSLSSETVTKSAEGTVRRSAEYRDLVIKSGPDDLPVTDFGSLPVVLRGFPWASRKSAKITFVGGPPGGASFSFELSVVGKDKLTVSGRVRECWHLTTGLGGPLSLLVPKSDWWFAVEGSHPLVKMTGPSGGPGSPVRTLLLTSGSE